MGFNCRCPVRCCLPPWVGVVQAALIIIFAFFTSYDPSPKDQKMLLGAYQGFRRNAISPSSSIACTKTQPTVPVELPECVGQIQNPFGQRARKGCPAHPEPTSIGKRMQGDGTVPAPHHRHLHTRGEGAKSKSSLIPTSHPLPKSSDRMAGRCVCLFLGGRLHPSVVRLIGEQQHSPKSCVPGPVCVYSSMDVTRGTVLIKELSVTLRISVIRAFSLLALQDFTIIAALGLGFLTSFLRRHGWSSVAFNLFMLALGVQWAVLLDGFLSQPFQGKVTINLFSIRLATMSAMSVLISAGSILGRANLVQLSVMVLVEVTAFGATRLTYKQLFNMDDHRSMMHVHVFAAYFGLAVAWCLSRPLPKQVEKEAQAEKIQMATSPSLFAMLGTLFLWIFWPSFNSALVDIANEKKNAVFNTYYALAVSTVTATSVSALNHHQGKINMIDIHNAVLAGGVAVGASCQLISSPWIAMVLGLLAGLISIGGARCMLVCFNHVLGIQDPSGVHYTFGLPGLLGGFAYIVLIVLKTSGTPGAVYMMLIDTGALSFALAMGLGSGLLTGLLLKLKIWKAPRVVKYFDDQAFWEFPHLAPGS
ncbi:RH-like protein IC [Erethizon dorsatum]